MELKVINQNKNKLLERMEVEAMLDHGKATTPSSDSVIRKVVEFLKVNHDQISLKYVATNFGEGKSRIFFHIYDSPQSLVFAENVKKKKKEAEAKQEQTATKPAK